MKILYDDDSLERNPPSSIQEDVTEVYCGGVVGIGLVFVPLFTLIITVIMSPLLIIGSVLAAINHDGDDED